MSRVLIQEKVNYTDTSSFKEKTSKSKSSIGLGCLISAVAKYGKQTKIWQKYFYPVKFTLIV